MSSTTLWDEIRDWFAHLPIALAYRIVWLAARLDLGSARMVYRAMWNANLALPPLPERPIQSSAVVCTVPPDGWYCTREPGHDGPCAARPAQSSPSTTEKKP